MQRSSSSSSSIESPWTVALPCTPKGSNAKEHTREEWETLRPRFTELYLSERRRLSDVSRILREDYGFHATDKQYKDRIRKWGLKKNFKDEEKRKALSAGLSTARSGDQGIPHRRLKRFAKEQKLVYVQGNALELRLPPQPTVEYGMVLEFPRYLFDTSLDSNAQTLYEAFAAIDRLAVARMPLLSFEVIGVSDTCVRYGLRRVERKAMPGVSFEMMPSGQDPTGREVGMGIRYCASVSTVLSRVQAGREEHPTHRALFHAISHSIYKACQYIFSPGSNPHNQHLYQAHRTVYTPAKNPYNDVPIPLGKSPEVRCLHYNATAQTAQNLFLRVMAQASLASCVLAVSEVTDAEMFSIPHIGSGIRTAVSQERDVVITLHQPVNIAMHLIRRGNLFAAALQFRPGHEGASIFMEGRMELEREKSPTLVAVVTGGPSSQQAWGPELPPATPRPPQNNGPTLTDDDAVEAEFENISQRAAIRTAFKYEPGRGAQFCTGQVKDFALVSRPMSAVEAQSEVGRTMEELVREGSLLDRKEPWKRGKLLQYYGHELCQGSAA